MAEAILEETEVSKDPQKSLEIRDGIESQIGDSSGAKIGDTSEGKIRWFFECGYGRFYQYLRMKSKTMFEVKCLSCPSKNLSVSISSAYNLKSHYEVICFVSFCFLF